MLESRAVSAHHVAGSPRAAAHDHFYDCSEDAPPHADAALCMAPPNSDDEDARSERSAPTMPDTPPAVAADSVPLSWFYVPLLLHAAGHLDSGRARQWLAHSSGGEKWNQLTGALAAAQLVCKHRLLASVHAAGLAEGSSADEVVRVCTNLGNLPPPVVSLPEAVEAVAGEGGYLRAAAQSAFGFGVLSMYSYIVHWGGLRPEHVLRADMHNDVPVADGRRIEVVANDPALEACWSQLTLDATKLNSAADHHPACRILEILCFWSCTYELNGSGVPAN